MAFPLTRLPITVELQINGVWTDISTDVRSQGGADAISIKRGIGGSGGGVAEAGSCTMTLDNNSGIYNNRNPSSPYYGLLGRNTPLRVSVAYGTPWLDCPHGVANTASTPDAAVLDIVGDIDVRVDAELAVWGEDVDVTSGTTELIGKYNVTGNQRSWRLTVNVAGQLDLTWSPDGTAQLTALSDPIPATPGSRLSVRATLDVNNGASGWTAVFYTSTTAGTSGPWTQLGSPFTLAGVTSIFSGSATLNVGDIPNLAFGNPARKIYKAEVRSGIAGTIVANPDFTAQTVGATSFTDTAPSARTWTVSAGALSNKFLRFYGEVGEWPPTWDTGGKDVTTPITASGILERYNQSKTVIQSALLRTLSTAVHLTAYWPMEDGAAATQAASPILGISPLRATGFNWASDSTLPGSAPLPQLSPPSAMTAPVPPVAVGDWTVACAFNLDTLPAAPTLLMQIGLTGGTATTVQFLVGVGVARVQALDGGGTVLGTFDVAPANFTSGWGVLQISTLTISGTVNLNAQWVMINVPGIINAVPATYAGTPGRVTSVTGAWGSGFADLRLGHLAVFTGSITAVYQDSIDGFDGETASERIARLASAQGVPMSISATGVTSELVGPQPLDTFLNAVTSAAAADEGLLYEAREFLGLRYRSRANLYNVPSALDIPYTTAGPQALVAPLKPVDDLQGVHNDSTVTRTNGSSGRSVIKTGPLSILDPPNGIGTGYDENVTLNLHSDDQPDRHAGWRTHLGTVDEARYPEMNLLLEKNPALIPSVMRMDTGSRVRVTAPLPKWLSPDAIDQMVLGYEENIAQFSWRFAFACQPYSPYKVGVVEDLVLGRVGPGGLSKLSAGVTSSATSLSVAVTGELWRTTGTNYPLDIRIAGEVMTLTAVSGASSPQTFTVTRSVNGVVKAQLANAVLQLATPSIVAL